MYGLLADTDSLVLCVVDQWKALRLALLMARKPEAIVSILANLWPDDMRINSSLLDAAISLVLLNCMGIVIRGSALPSRQAVSSYSVQWLEYMSFTG